MARIGLILAIFGFVYIIKPDLYRRWFWKKTDILQQKLSPQKYIRFMRFLGVVFLLVGTALMIFGNFEI
jgi:hypothetical protein